MRVLTLSPDGRELLAPDSALRRRFVLYGELVERFDVVYPDTAERVTPLSDRVTLYGVPSPTKVSYFFRLIFHVLRLQKKARYDVVSTPDPYFLGGLAWVLGAFLNIGVELQIHGFEKWHGVRPWLARVNLRHATHIRAVSKRLANQLVASFGIPAARIAVFPIFVDPTRFLPLAERRGTEAHTPFTFVTVSRLVPVKRIELQLQAFALILKQHEARLLIVGDGPERSSLEAVAAGLRLGSAVRFCGAQADITSFLAEADAFLLTSAAEGYGIAPIEAACAGLPVIMTDVGCANELIQDGVHGRILPVDAPLNVLVDAMRQLIEEPDTRQRMSADAASLAHTLPTQAETLHAYAQSWERSRRINR